MNAPIDMARLESSVELLENVPADSRLMALQNLCENNGGRWDPRINLPDLEQPCLYEIQIFDVPAMSVAAEELPANWMSAARNIFEFDDQTEGAAA